VPGRVVVDQNGVVVSVEAVPGRTAPPSSKGSTGEKTGANKRRKGKPKFKWRPKRTTGFSAAARRRVQKERSRQEQKKVARIRSAEEALRQAEKVAAVEQLTNFDEAHALGVAASDASSPDYPLAIAAFKKAYRLDPRRKVKSGSKPEPGLFEVPMKLAAAYKRNGQFYESQKMYEWVLKHHDSRVAKTELALLHEDGFATRSRAGGQL
jgi:tetratricopeptide (TPR) repeat protein